MNEKNYILYGASFNPPHIGHFSAITQMLEKYDKVIIFPYPKKYFNGFVQELPSIQQRMKLLEIFFSEFFPQLEDRVILANLSKQINQPNTILHTYDYLKYVESNLPSNIKLSVCLGFSDEYKEKRESFFKEDEMKKSYDCFLLEENININSSKIREFFSNNKNVNSSKVEQFLNYSLGHLQTKYIIENALYDIKTPSLNKIKLIK